jgi:hypothetical protein
MCQLIKNAARNGAKPVTTSTSVTLRCALRFTVLQKITRNGNSRSVTIVITGSFGCLGILDDSQDPLSFVEAILYSYKM